MLISALLAKKTFWILEVMEKWIIIVTMFLDWICSIFALIINLSLSLVNGLEFSETLGLNIWNIGSTKLNDMVEGIDTSDPYNKLWFLFKMFLVACPLAALKHSSSSSYYNVTFFDPCSLLVPILNSFKLSWRWSFKFASTKTKFGWCNW